MKRPALPSPLPSRPTTMFKKLTDKLTSAVYGTSTTEDDKIRVLQTMGFEPSSARTALQQTNGDIDRAAELLLSGTMQTSAAVNTTARTAATNEDEALRNAMQESLQTEEQRRYAKAQKASMQPAARVPAKTTNKKKSPPRRTAASSRAGQAAANRSKNNHSPIQEHHPNVKVPTKLQDKTKEEQVLRNVNRMKGHPAAVDTLLKSLTALRNNPNNAKFRTIDQTNAGYQRSLAPAPGAEALLLTMNFVKVGGQKLVLDRSRVDPALLYLGISGLETAKESVEYKEAKRLLVFEKELQQIHLSVNSSTDEALKRADFISKTPSEPSSGSGALLQVVFGQETIKRRFDGDDVLQDVLHWLGGHGSAIPSKLTSREWCLMDLNRYPPTPIDCQQNVDKTLQYVGFWPSGRLEIRPSPQEWLDRTEDASIMGSARGLGAAPKDTL